MRSKGRAGGFQPAPSERRENYELRELLEELLALTRTLARKHSLMTREELAIVEERIIWLAEEIYGAATEPVRAVSSGSGVARERR